MDSIIPLVLDIMFSHLMTTNETTQSQIFNYIISPFIEMFKNLKIIDVTKQVSHNNINIYLLD